MSKVEVTYNGYTYPGHLIEKSKNGSSVVRIMLPFDAYITQSIKDQFIKEFPKVGEKLPEKAASTNAEFLYPIGSKVEITGVGQKYEGVVKSYDSIRKFYNVEVDTGSGKLQIFDCTEAVLKAVPRDEHEVKDDREIAKAAVEFWSKFKRDQVVKVVKPGKHEGKVGAVVDRPKFDSKLETYIYSVVIETKKGKVAKKFKQDDLVARPPLTPRQWVKEPSKRKFNLEEAVTFTNEKGKKFDAVVTGWHHNDREHTTNYTIVVDGDVRAPLVGIPEVSLQKREVTVETKPKFSEGQKVRWNHLSTNHGMKGTVIYPIRKISADEGEQYFYEMQPEGTTTAFDRLTVEEGYLEAVEQPAPTVRQAIKFIHGDYVKITLPSGTSKGTIVRKETNGYIGQ